MTETVPVALLGVPLDLHRASAAHIDALQREFEMILREDPVGADEEVPGRFRSLLQHLKERFQGYREEADQALVAARESGASEVDLAYDVPTDVVGDFRNLLDLLGEVDAYCRAGDMMTLATPPEIRTFRSWFYGEFIAQIEGRPPVPWATSPDGRQFGAVAETDGSGRWAGAEDGLDDSWHVSTEGSTLRVSFTGDLDLESAPHLRSLVARASQEEGLSGLVIDLSAVTFLDSVGLSVLLTVRTRLVSEEVSVTVVPSDAVRRVFTLAGVDGLF